MGENTTIEWTESTWNPVTGCTKVSPGCAYCYAERITRRRGGDPFLPKYSNVRLHEERLSLPLQWKRSKMIFTCSMSDLFHEEVPFWFISEVFEVMKQASWHTFQVLTKRSDRMAEFFRGWGPAPCNVWLGVSAENQRFANVRIPILIDIPATVHFVSCEPLLGQIDLSKWLGASGINWVIAGGESGGPEKRRLVERCQHKATTQDNHQCDNCDQTGWVPKAHAVEWVRILREQCVSAETSFFFKQWGGPRPGSAGRMIDGCQWNQWPGGGRMATIDNVGPWSLDKLNMLTEYLQAYARIMQNQKRTWLRQFHYIDAFAGSGFVRRRDEDADRDIKQYLEGSALRALRCEPPFDRLWFIERNEIRAQTLYEINEEQRAQDRVSMLVGDANNRVQQVVSRLNPRNERGLVFLDPYGLQIEWETVSALGQAGIFDVFINFSLMGIMRNLTRRSSPSQAFRQTLRKVMQDDSWVDNLYVTQSRLWDDPMMQRGEMASARLAEQYTDLLRTEFKYVSDYMIMKNSTGGAIYALIFASPNETAKNIMNDIIRKYKSR